MGTLASFHELLSGKKSTFYVRFLCDFSLATPVVRQLPNATPSKTPSYRLWAALPTKSDQMVGESIASSTTECHCHNHEWNLQRTIPFLKFCFKKVAKFGEGLDTSPDFLKWSDVFCISRSINRPSGGITSQSIIGKLIKNFQCFFPINKFPIYYK